jgi:hypothetical protein
MGPPPSLCRTLFRQVDSVLAGLEDVLQLFTPTFSINDSRARVAARREIAGDGAERAFREAQGLSPTPASLRFQVVRKARDKMGLKEERARERGRALPPWAASHDAPWLCFWRCCCC